MTHKQNDDVSKGIIDRLKSYRPVAYMIVLAAILGGVASFGDSISKIISIVSSSLRDGATPVILPYDTGWIFAGYFDEVRKTYVQGPYFKIVRSQYPATDALPRPGEQLKIISERNIIIADFKTMGLTRRFDPPWQQNELSDVDYTGLKLPKGAIVEVRDVSRGSFPDKPSAVWVRIGVAR